VTGHSIPQAPGSLPLFVTSGYGSSIDPISREKRGNPPRGEHRATRVFWSIIIIWPIVCIQLRGEEEEIRFTTEGAENTEKTKS